MRLELLTVKEMLQADASTVNGGVPSIELMEAAGEGVVREIRKRWTRRSVLVLAGPGNNGGDGFVIARLLKKLNWPVKIALFANADDFKGDAKLNLDRWTGEIVDGNGSALRGVELFVDAIFGAGLARNVEGKIGKFLQKLRENDKPIVAVDIPSGVDGNTGEIRGVASSANLTVTFFRKKPGHVMLPGRDICGEIVLRQIGVPDGVLDDISPTTMENGPGLWSYYLPRPETTYHKYDRGHLLIVGGESMTGAARLAARAARRTGVGIVSILASSKTVDIYRSCDPGNLVLDLADTKSISEILMDVRKNCVLVGPGGGVSQETRKHVISALKTKRPVILDADALTSFEEDPETLFSWIKGPCIMTPHSGEFQRIFNFQGDRLTKCRSAAKMSGAVVLLKGSDTVIADPSGRAIINSNAPSCLAVAGSGDVLAGIIAGLVSQGMPIFEAAGAATWMHGAAAKSVGGGLISEDLADHLPSIPYL